MTVCRKMAQALRIAKPLTLKAKLSVSFRVDGICKLILTHERKNTMGMTKADRLEFDQRRKALDYWAQLTLDNALGYNLTSKSKWLAEQRAKETEQQQQR